MEHAWTCMACCGLVACSPITSDLLGLVVYSLLTSDLLCKLVWKPVPGALVTVSVLYYVVQLFT